MTAEIDKIRERDAQMTEHIRSNGLLDSTYSELVDMMGKHDVHVLLKEIDRLTAEVEGCKKMHGDRCRDLQRVADENTALREALEFYANGEWSDGYPGGIVYRQDGHVALDMGAIAKAAVKVKKASEERTKVCPYHWCPNCKMEVDGSCVTFEELHDACGYAVEVRGGTP